MTLRLTQLTCLARQSADYGQPWMIHTLLSASINNEHYILNDINS